MKRYLQLFATLTGLTLISACGGVTIPEGALNINLGGSDCENNVFRTTCSEFQVERNQIINNCRNAITINPIPPAECANAITFVCTGENGNPFHALCVGQNYQAIREEVVADCLIDIEDVPGLCARAVVSVCGDSPFDALCTEETDYDDDRLQVINRCRASNNVGTQCVEEVVEQACGTNPYDALCDGNVAYNAARDTIFNTCGLLGDERHDLCEEAIKPVCEANPFGELCLVGDTYAAARANTASECATNPEGELCGQASTALVCGDNPFVGFVAPGGEATASPINPLCTANVSDAVEEVTDAESGEVITEAVDAVPSTYNLVRENLCQTQLDDPKCAGTIARVCATEGSIFSPLCYGDNTYHEARVTECEMPNGKIDNNCAATVVTVCDADHFEILCVGEEAYVEARNSDISSTCDENAWDELCRGNPNYLQAQIDACAEGSEPEDVTCLDHTSLDAVIAGCIGDPFVEDSECDTSNEFAPYRDGARQKRALYCNGGSSGEDTVDGALCTGYNRCSADADAAFADGCAGPTFASVRSGACTGEAAFDGRCSDPSYDTEKHSFCGDDATAFNASCINEYRNVGVQRAFCAKDSNTFHAKCVGDIADTVTQDSTCLGDPFIADCINVDKYDATRTGICLDTPFDVRCTAENTYENTAAKGAFCDDNPFDAVNCVGEYAREGQKASFCQGAPFDGNCTDETYASDRVTFCNNDPFNASCSAPAYNGAKSTFCTGEQAFHASCAATTYNDAKTAFCTGDNVFNANCEGTYVNQAGKNTFCTNNPADLNCAGEEYTTQRAGTINCEANDEGSGGTTCRNEAALNTSTTTTDHGSGTRFVGGALSVELNAAGDDVVAPTGSSVVATDSLGNIGTRFHRRGGEGSDNRDGFVRFVLEKDGSGQNRQSTHIMVLATTNLGAPIANQPANALWPGHFINEIGESFATNFYITFAGSNGAIGFANDAGTGVGAGNDRPAFARLANNDGVGYALNVTFDANGLLGGTATLGGFFPGIAVSGLIGEEGVIAIIAAPNGSGGFTASNPDHASYVAPPRVIPADTDATTVDYADWTAVENPDADRDTSDARNQFLAGRTGTSPSAGSKGFLNFYTAPYENTTFGEDSNDGFELIYRGVNVYAGILSGTDLGAPLTAETATATWQGSFLAFSGADASTREESNFFLNVEFGTKNITGVANGAGWEYDFSSKFDTRGLIDGTITRTVNAVASTGTLSGLIAEDGAIGIFHSDAGAAEGFVGGFVARRFVAEADYSTDTDATKVQYSDWVGDGSAVDSKTDTTNRKTQFLRYDGGSFNQNGDTTNSSVITFAAPATTFVDTTGLFDDSYAGDAADGFAYYSHTPQVGDGTAYFGILETTDLGAPLTAETAEATWQGSMLALTDAGTISSTFILSVGFSAGNNTFISRLDTSSQFIFNGNFNDRGVITNGVATYAPQTLGAGQSTGTLTGIIGHDGAVGVFKNNDGETHFFAGGFVVRAARVPVDPCLAAGDCKADHERWAGSFEDLATTPVLSAGGTRQNFFIGGITAEFFADNYLHFDQTNPTSRAGKLVRLGNNTASSKGSLTFADSNFGGSGDDGVFAVRGSFEGNSANSLNFHAGIFTSTDLGAPLNDVAQAGEWRGLALFVDNGSYRNNVEFTLTVDFTNSAISAVINNSNLFFDVDGTWDEFGVITGEVNAAANNPAINDNNIAERSDIGFYGGVLTGLIGQEGAVGAFHGDNADGFNFAGGFIARPFTTCEKDSTLAECNPRYAAWAGSFTGDDALATTPPLDATSRTRNNSFIGGLTAASLSEFPNFTNSNAGQVAGKFVGSFDRDAQVLTLADNDLGGEADNGVLILRGSFESLVAVPLSYHAGILSGTDLGAPLNDVAQGGTWYGWITTTNGSASDVISKSFELTVNYGTASISARVNGPLVDFDDASYRLYYDINGNWDGAGIITGTANYSIDQNVDSVIDASDEGFAPGVLTGIIGQDGAVGAFHSTGGSNVRQFAGGFVARPGFNPSTANYAAWTGSFTTALNTNPTIKNEFLAGGATDISKNNRSIVNSGSLNLSTAIFNNAALGGDATDGVAFFTAQAGTLAGVYAGLLSGTDLGAPLTAQPAEAIWRGAFQLSGKPVVDFELTIAFQVANGVSGAISGNPYDNLELAGTFNSNGVITGTTLHTGGWGPGTLTGLIGEEGAIGAFYDDDNDRYVGGFVVRPGIAAKPEPVGTVSYAEDLVPVLSARGVPHTPSVLNSFVGSNAGGINRHSRFTRISNDTGLRLTTAKYNGKALTRGVDTDLVAFYAGRLFNTQDYYFFAGIGSETNLGAPVGVGQGNTFGGQPKATWRGQFLSIGKGALNKDINVDIDFVTGKISSFVQHGEVHSENFWEIKGKYNADGVISNDGTNGVLYGSYFGTLQNRVFTTNKSPNGNAFATGDLVGLIGEEGIIAAFAGRRDSSGRHQPGGFSGGFVAVPSVAAAPAPQADITTLHSWRTAPDNTLEHYCPAREANSIMWTRGQTLDNCGILQTGPDAAAFDLAYIGYVYETRRVNVLGASTAQSGLVGGYTYKSGVDNRWDFHFGFGNVHATQRRRNYHAGIHEDTNVGIPVPNHNFTNGGVTAYWRGHISIVRNYTFDTPWDRVAHNEKFFPLVNFRFKKITGSSGGYTINGSWDDSGVVRGNVAANGAGLENHGAGYFSGVIGQKGVVAAIISTDHRGHYGYSGGFIACPTNNPQWADGQACK